MRFRNLERSRKKSGTTSELGVSDELHLLRRLGFLRFSDERYRLPRLVAAAGVANQVSEDEVLRAHVEQLLKRAIDGFGANIYGEAAALLFGVAPTVRGYRPDECRKRATELFYRDSNTNNVDSFRKTHEQRLIAELAELVEEVQRNAVLGVQEPEAGPDDGGPLSDDPVATRQVVEGDRWREKHRSFWRLPDAPVIDVVCSEIPAEERAPFASISDRNYLRYAKFADLDTLICLRTSLAVLYPEALVRDFAHTEYGVDNSPDALFVIGGPPWNSVFGRFQVTLPFHFEPHPLGEDDPLVIGLDEPRRLAPTWAGDGTAIRDVSVFTRVRPRDHRTIYLLGGCLTLGVLGAALCFQADADATGNLEYIDRVVGERDFVLVTETTRVGLQAQPPSLEDASTLFLLCREHRDAAFEPVETRMRG